MGNMEPELDIFCNVERLLVVEPGYQARLKIFDTQFVLTTRFSVVINGHIELVRMACQ